MDCRLKGALIAKFGTQTAASKELRITERRLSRLIHGHETLTPEEVRVFEEKLGVTLTTPEARAG